MRVTVNGNERDVAADDDVVPRAEHATRLLHDGDRLEIIVAVAGG
jgi:thiamine biosynthesis protein ThiS